VHSKKFTKSLNELYTDPAPDVPFNYRITMPITRSVSTATEINDHNSPTTPSANQNTKTKSTSTLKELTNDMCGIRKNSSTSTSTQSPMEEKLFQEFCKKMGPRPKPQTIYYIDNDEGGFQNDDDIFIIDNSNRRTVNSCDRRKSIGTNDYDDRIARVREKQKQQHLQRQPFSLPTNRSLCDLDKIYPENYLNFKENSSNLNVWNKNTRNCNTLPRNFLKNNKFRLENDVNG
jgi:hypothetical protein